MELLNFLTHKPAQTSQCDCGDCSHPHAHTLCLAAAGTPRPTPPHTAKLSEAQTTDQRPQPELQASKTALPGHSRRTNTTAAQKALLSTTAAAAALSRLLQLLLPTPAAVAATDVAACDVT